MVVLPIFLFFLGWVRCQEPDPCTTTWPEYNKYCYDPCLKFPSRIQRDKCQCDMGTNISLCDVYCKQPYLNNSVCEKKSLENDKYRDEWQCKFLSINESCINYCNSSGTVDEDCWCTYVYPDPLCPKYCKYPDPPVTTLDKNRKLECSCKYHSDDSTSITEDCYNFCNKEMHADTWAEFLQCQCTYLSNSSACQALCKSAGNDLFSQNECLCLLDKKKGLNYTSDSCKELSVIIDDPDNVVTYPADVYVPNTNPSDPKYGSDDRDFDPDDCIKRDSDLDKDNNCTDADLNELNLKKEERKRLYTMKVAWNNLKDKIDEANRVTKDASTVSQCYYEENFKVCEDYCNSLNDTNQTDSCKCTKMNDKASCAAVCKHEIEDEDAMLECQCMVGPMYCEQYCYKHYGDDFSIPITDDVNLPKNKKFQECNCTLSSGEEGTDTNPSCELYCEMVFNPENNATETEKTERTGLCENFCMAKTTEANPDGQSICRCKTLHDYSGCEPFCKMLNGTRSDENIDNCRKYCHTLGWAEDTTDCLCTHNVDGHFCRDYCLSKDGFSLTFCETYCSALDRSQSLKCRCSYLDGSKCIDFCNDKGATACNATEDEIENVGQHPELNTKLQSCLEDVPEVLNCYCSFGIGLSNKREDLTGACSKECDALGKTGRVVERARCVCRNQINITACADYCDMSLAGHANSRHLRDKCKCDYEQGDEYCKAYSLSLPHEHHLKYECTVNGNKSACYDYCLNYVSPLGDEIETYKCWCEMYGDLIWCPVYCDSLRPNDDKKYIPGTEEHQKIEAELYRCKCFHYEDQPSCQQYCPTITNETLRIECECLILNDFAGCKLYCASLPTYGERIVCACRHEVDSARCVEIATLKIGALEEKPVLPPRSETIKPRCDTNVTTGKEYVKACRNYCIAVQEESVPGILVEFKNKIDPTNFTTTADKEFVNKIAERLMIQKAREVVDMCMCDVAKSETACDRYCNEKFPILKPGVNITEEQINVSKGYYARCLCQHKGEATECKRSCDLIYPRNPPKYNNSRVKTHKQNALNTECICNLTEEFGPGGADYLDALTYCGESCKLRYGVENSVKYYSCFLQYDREKKHNSSFCKTFWEPTMRKFCDCFYNPNTSACDGTCYGLEDKKKGEGLPKKSMCECFINDTSKCSVFCEDPILSPRDCNKSCASIADDDSKAMEYANCLCTGIKSASACRSVCDQHYHTNKTAYHHCRCDKKLGTLSCQHMCERNFSKSDSPASDYQKCIRGNVNITIGTVEGKERYLSDYDVDDIYVFNDIPETWVREVEEKEEEEEEEKKEVEEEEEEEEEEKKKEVEEEKVEEEEEEEEEAVQELKKEEVPADDPVTKQGWVTNKTNMLLVIMASSVFAVAVVAAIIVVFAVYRLGNSSAAGDGEKSTTMFEMEEQNPTEKAETSLDPSNEFAEEQKKAPGEEMDVNVDE